MGQAAGVIVPLAAGAMAGGLFGGGKKKKSTGNPADIQAQLAQQLFQQTDPLRRSLIGRSQDFLGGGDVMESPQYADLQVQTGRAFNQAKDNVIARTAPGGALVDALTNLEGDRAAALSSGAAGLEQTELDRALALATGTVPAAMGGLGSAANAQALLAQARAQKDAAEKGALGSAAGMFLGSK